MAQRLASWHKRDRYHRRRIFYLPSVYFPSLTELGIEQDFDNIQRELHSVQLSTFFDSGSTLTPSSSSITDGANSISNTSSRASLLGKTRMVASKRRSRLEDDSQWKGNSSSSPSIHKPLPRIPEACYWRSGPSSSTSLLLPPLPAIKCAGDIEVTSGTSGLSNRSPTKNSDSTVVGRPFPSNDVSSRSTYPKTEPRPIFFKMSSLDNILRYQMERAEWKRSQTSVTEPRSGKTEWRGLRNDETLKTSIVDRITWDDKVGLILSTGDARLPSTRRTNSVFRHPYAEYGFWFCICMTQFLTEFLLSGFAIELTRLTGVPNNDAPSSHQSTGKFWPASLLTLILSATLLIWARLSDMYGGYFVFMFGLIWMTIWCFIPGCNSSLYVLDVSRAMQGLAIGAFAPATIVIMGTLYEEGKRKSFVMSLWTGFATIGFFAGFLVAGAVPEPWWYFWIPGIISACTAVMAFLTIPIDDTSRCKMQLKMDWLGAVLISLGLVLVIYALSSEPYATQGSSIVAGWASPRVAAALGVGIFSLVSAFYFEGWVAACPLLPFEFFRYKHVKTLSLSCLSFYASYGVWLYYSAEYFQIPAMTRGNVKGVRLSMWYAPIAVVGIFFCVFGGKLLHVAPTMALLVVSALFWVGAPLLLAVCPLHMNYWTWVFPAMISISVGINLTYTICMMYITAIQPLRHQGLTGAVGSILFNLGISFALSVAQIVCRTAENAINVHSHEKYLGDTDLATKRWIWGCRAAFVYAASSAGLGLIVCLLFVRIRLIGQKDAQSATSKVPIGV